MKESEENKITTCGSRPYAKPAIKVRTAFAEMQLLDTSEKTLEIIEEEEEEWPTDPGTHKPYSPW